MNKRGWLYMAQLECVLLALQQERGNRTRAAELLGCSIRQLRDWLKVYEREGFKIIPADSNVWRQKKEQGGKHEK